MNLLPVTKKENYTTEGPALQENTKKTFRTIQNKDKSNHIKKLSKVK